jgi:hypothetical protein
VEITAEYLTTELNSLRAQRENAQTVVQQATGAIALVESLLERLKDGALTIPELTDAINRAEREAKDGSES